MLEKIQHYPWTIVFRYLYALIFLLPASVYGTIYRHIDSTGNIQYSDIEGTNASIVHLKLINSYSLTGNSKAANKEHAISTQNYSEITINQPANQQTFQNQRAIPIHITTQPLLAAGDSIEIWLDGNLYQRKTSPQFVLENLDRGEHNIEAKILSNTGKILKSSTNTRFFVHLHSSIK